MESVLRKAKIYKFSSDKVTQIWNPKHELTPPQSQYYKLEKVKPQ